MPIQVFKDCQLALQDPLHCANLSLHLAAPVSGGAPEPVGTLQSWDTVHARLPGVHAAAAGLSHGDLVQLQANLGSKYNPSQPLYAQLT